MGYEKELKKQYKREDQEKLTRQKEADANYKELRQVLKEAKALSNKIENMSPTDYDKFIDTAIRRLSLKEARIADYNDKAINSETSKTDKIGLSEKQVNVIILSHVIVLGGAGLVVGAVTDFFPGYDVHRTILSGCVGAGSGIFTAYFHTLIKDKHLLANALKEFKRKTLNKKAQKIAGALEHENKVLEELATMNNNSCKYNVDAKIASDRILNGVAETKEKLYSSYNNSETGELDQENEQ